MEFHFGPRRAVFSKVDAKYSGVTPKESTAFEFLDLVYRSLCAVLYNYVPGSGHPGGSISSGRIVQNLLYNSMDYDLSDPRSASADMIVYAAGHKALGLYAGWALRNEIARVAAPHLLPNDETLQFRLEDLLGFRRNPNTDTPLFREFKSRALDGHPTPATPFVKVATGASGVGVGAAIGLALGALDAYGESAPFVHIIEGEGGLTPGRVAEAMACAGTAGISNIVMHIDWNQAAIESNKVCRESEMPGDYVQWDPCEFAYLNDWNVIVVQDGFDHKQIEAAQREAISLDNNQPTAIVYRTIKGWKYGIEGKASHGAGHKLCSAGFLEAVEPLLQKTTLSIQKCDCTDQRCHGKDAATIEQCLLGDTSNSKRRNRERD